MRISDWSSDVCSSDLYGDLTPWFSGFFDTDIGGKLEAGSYTRIAVAIGLMPRSILFLSDNPEEVAAAGRAGMQTIRLLRDEPPEPGAGRRFAALEMGEQATRNTVEPTNTPSPF